ncbi:MAG TPA: PASTA domain-containing protein [Gaiellaceae bacterium]|nr:PASTA domain-containing protein [Gaiellaceae bacterium]
MTAGVIGRLPRVGLIVCAIGLVSGTLAFAATSTLSTPTAPAAAPVVAKPEPLVVPDVRKQAYVFAKGSLEQSGFAWRVEGAVPGFAANVVVSQAPAPGARVIADGAPIIVLRLSRNGSYEQEGVPENVSPYAGKPARLVGAAKPKRKPAQPAAAVTPKPAPTPKAKPKAKPAVSRARPPAFKVAGAPAEPLDEIVLSTRAKRLAAWVEKHPRRTPANVEHWLYQHNWIVTGAGFGWAEGAKALRTLIAVDERVQRLWGVGAQSEQLARHTLAEVEKRSH